ncbi:flagellar hook-length control protein FliK [Paenibacillus sepulcri]
MNIGQLMRGLIGDAQPVDSKALELKIGQIVRGVLLQVLDNQDALVQINGVQVRAKLEVPLQPGQSTLLQVQPQSGGGALVLKPVDQQAADLPEGSLKEWVKALGLPDQKWSLALVRDLRREGAAPLKDAAAQFQEAKAAMPAGGDARLWMQAAALGYKRGLPITAATIGSLQQVLSGTQAHALLEALEQGLAAWSGASAGDNADDPAQPRTAAQAAAAKLAALLPEGAALMRAAQGAGGAQPPAAGPGAGTAAAPEAGAAGEAAAPSAARSAAMAAPVPGSATGAPPAERAAAGAQAAGASAAAGGAKPAPAAQPTAAGAAQQAPSAAAEDSAAAGNPQRAGGWVGQLIKWLGVDHEHLLAASAGSSPKDGTAAEPPANEARASKPSENNPQQPARIVAAAHQETHAPLEQKSANNPSPADMSRQPGSSSLPVHAAADEGALPGPAQSTADKPAAADTLKSALITLAAGDDVPQALKDTAQQLVQHITGQQLLLTPERTASLFSHVTLFIPMQGQDGSQTASVHIQTRRGRKGELDAENCRLLFDLRMNTLGETVVDVQVVNKIVSLNLWNDHPAIAELLESSRPEMNEALQKAGFQLLSLRATPMPDRSRQGEDGSSVEDSSAAVVPAWSMKPYKGVDFRA